ncbi:hypothetical protein M514_02230 [Trichuris suis]|uniref:Uncharacterized protein n=1 Tax=Trichuris suis TaxID=68888 RepID=A0A085MIC7_9BILA|nr:hypothetical protein M513_02230 [Trichuris suis]KFD70078.1 hypothetical protein M514_02230 [Trichuris suis]
MEKAFLRAQIVNLSKTGASGCQKARLPGRQLFCVSSKSFDNDHLKWKRNCQLRSWRKALIWTDEKVSTSYKDVG